MKIIAAAFQITEEWCFPFWNIIFCFRDNDMFVLRKLRKCHFV